MTAIRETFFTMKNSFVSSSKPSGIQATSSDHLDLISGKIESAVRNILRENLKDFDYEITASDVSVSNNNEFHYLIMIHNNNSIK